MFDYQRIVEEIQAALASAQIEWDLLRDCAAEYAASCDETNQRLNECERLLRQGLRSEAIQLCEQEPNLLDATGMLDFPELEAWRQLLGANGMVLPPCLRLDIAADLNTAYAEEEPLKALLKTHRLLALARAPLVGRIQVLRAMHQVDAGNPAWIEDLQVFERQRQLQLAHEADTAIACGDLLTLEGLVQELESPLWLSPPTPQIAGQVQAARQQVVAADARQQLPAVSDDLQLAYENFDLEAALAARTRWDALLEVANANPRDPIILQAEVVLGWIDEQLERQARKEAHAAALRNLEKALDRDTPRADLERLMLAVERFDEEIPQRTLMRFGERMRSFETAGSRRFTLLISSVVGALAIVAGITTWLILRYQHEATVSSAARELRTLVQKEQTGEAERFLEKLPPKISNRPEITAITEQLNEMVKKETLRANQFAQLMDALEARGPGGNRASDVLEARPLARTMQEKERLADWVRKIADHEHEQRTARETAFTADLQTLIQEAQTLEENLTLNAWETRLAAAQEQAKSLASRRTVLNPELGLQLNPVVARLTALQRLQQSQQQQAAQLKSIRKAVGNPDQYRTAML